MAYCHYGRSEYSELALTPEGAESNSSFRRPYRWEQLPHAPAGNGRQLRAARLPRDRGLHLGWTLRRLGALAIRAFCFFGLSNLVNRVAGDALADLIIVDTVSRRDVVFPIPTKLDDDGDQHMNGFVRHRYVKNQLDLVRVLPVQANIGRSPAAFAQVLHDEVVVGCVFFRRLLMHHC